jgi:uncharacterized protein (TIGR02302 family)
MTQGDRFGEGRPAGGRFTGPGNAADEEFEAFPEVDARLKQTLDRKVRLAHFVLLVERLWPLVWGPFAVAGTFALASLLGLWPFLTLRAHEGLLATFALAFVLSLTPLARFRKPTRAEALRRLETTAGLKHRPASTFEDSLAAELDAPETRRLWRLHRQRMAVAFDRLRAGWPHPRVDLRDPFALRAALILLLTASFAAHGQGSWERLASAFILRGAPGAASARVDAWITPPVYTGKPPVMLIDASRPANAGLADEGVIETPEKSELTIRVNDAHAQDFRLRVLSRDGEKTIAPARPVGADASSASRPSSAAELKAQITSDLAAQLVQDGAAVARWKIRIIPDRAPAIRWTEQPTLMQRGSLRFRYKVSDDYGVVAAQALLKRIGPGSLPSGHTSISPDARAGGSGYEPIVFPLSLPRANLRSGKGQTYKDLTSHPWAGLPVSVVLTARDQAGQTSKTDPITFVLPERRFTKPLAQAVIEQRRTLVERPEMRNAVAKALDALTLAPETYVPDKTVYLGLRSAYWRLMIGRGPGVRASIVDQLWRVALRIEDGDLSGAERELRAAQDRLMRALDENASPQEIKRLMDELRAALNHFLASAARNALNQNEVPPHQQGAEQVTSKELNDILSKIETLARTGSKDMARRMLSQLRDMLESVETGSPQRSGQSEQMMKSLDGLSNLITRQQKLLDETFRAQQREEDRLQDARRSPTPGQEGEQQRDGPDGADESRRGGAQGERLDHSGKSPAPQEAGSFQALSRKQQELSQSLDELLEEARGLGAPPSTQLKDAQRAMGDASKALDRRNAGQAVEQETLALERLRKGTQSLAEQMMEASRPGGGRRGRIARDPLGRPQRNQGADSGDDVILNPHVQRARKILDELRRRLEEPSRPAQELDYIERLIRRF